jgi:hypothetical protein
MDKDQIFASIVLALLLAVVEGHCALRRCGELKKSRSNKGDPSVEKPHAHILNLCQTQPKRLRKPREGCLLSCNTTYFRCHRHPRAIR